jgi:enolase
MATISNVFAREILDSRGLPTVECWLWLDTGHFVTAAVPSGTSKGKYEAVELRDNDTTRMSGYGVLNAVNNIISVIGPKLVGQDPTQQKTIDELLISLDGTPNKSKLGANAILAVSQAVATAGAAVAGQPLYRYLHQLFQIGEQPRLPTCIYGLINGGEHGADNLDIQEFEIIPASHFDMNTSLNIAVTIFHQLGQLLISKGAIHSVGMAGGYAPNLYNNTDAFELMIETIKLSPFTFAQDVFFGIDISSSSFFEAGKYILKDKSQPYSSAELLEYYRTLRKQYHVFYFEDPFQEDDWGSWQTMVAEMGETTTIAGDDLLATNKEKLTKAIQDKACNAITIKPNQVGTLTETIDVIKMAKEAGMQVIMSHRSGETNDAFIADLAVAVGADYARFGPPNRGERTVKYNRLLQIHQELSQA